jgi:hypothetical protein
MRLPRAGQSKPRMTALRRTHHRAAVADQPAGDGDQPPPQGCDHGLAAAHAVSCQDVHADSGAGELVQPGGHVRGEQRSPHPGQVYLGVSRREVPEGGAELAVAEDVFHRGAVPSRRRSPRYRPVQGAAGPAGRDAGCGGAVIAGRRRPGPDPAGPGGPAAGCLPATSPGSTQRRRPGHCPSRSRRARRRRRCRPAAATAARSSCRRSRTRSSPHGRRGPAARRGTRRRRAAPAARPAPARAGRPTRGAAARRGRARVLGPVAQVGGQHDLGLGPGRHVCPANPLPLMVIGHPALLAAIDPHVGGVRVDRHRAPRPAPRPAPRAAATASGR